MKIVKRNGEVAEFDEKKVYNSIIRTGLNKAQADIMMTAIISQVKELMTTKEIYSIVHSELKKENVAFSGRYNLKKALLRLGPAGYKFEKYVASILNAYKYNAFNPLDDISGSCVKHEVDVIAEKDGRRIFIEAKFRNEVSGYVNLKDVMATWSRFLDLVDGSAVGRCQHFDECWVVTNARFSDRAQQFGTCKGIHLIGWDFPKSSSFSHMVDIVKLYPITVIDNLSQSEIDNLSRYGIMLCSDVVKEELDDFSSKLGSDEERARGLMDMCSKIIGGQGEGN